MYGARGSFERQSLAHGHPGPSTVRSVTGPYVLESCHSHIIPDVSKEKAWVSLAHDLNRERGGEAPIARNGIVCLLVAVFLGASPFRFIRIRFRVSFLPACFPRMPTAPSTFEPLGAGGSRSLMI